MGNYKKTLCRIVLAGFIALFPNYTSHASETEGTSGAAQVTEEEPEPAGTTDQASTSEAAHTWDETPQPGSDEETSKTSEAAKTAEEPAEETCNSIEATEEASLDAQSAEEASQPAQVLNVDFPTNYPFLLFDNKSGGRQLTSQIFHIANYGSDDIVIDLSDIWMEAAKNIVSQELSEPVDSSYQSATKDVFAFLKVVHYDTVPDEDALHTVDIPMEEVSPEEGDYILTGSQRTDRYKVTLAGANCDSEGNFVSFRKGSVFSFYIAGSVTPNQTLDWKQGDLKIELTARIQTAEEAAEEEKMEQSADGDAENGEAEDAQDPLNVEQEEVQDSENAQQEDAQDAESLDSSSGDAGEDPSQTEDGSEASEETAEDSSETEDTTEEEDVAEPSGDSSSSDSSFLVFQVEDSCYAIDDGNVIATMQLPDMEEEEDPSEAVVGTISYEGKEIPVISLRSLFGMSSPQDEIGESESAIWEERQMSAIVIDDGTSSFAIEADELLPMEDLADAGQEQAEGQDNSPYISAVKKSAGSDQLISVLDGDLLGKMISND